jgi:predicted membrane protein
MVISFLLALPLAAVLLVHPGMMLDANGHYNHSVLMLVMVGISGGFIHGVGLYPNFGYGNGYLVLIFMATDVDWLLSMVC